MLLSLLCPPMPRRINRALALLLSSVACREALSLDYALGQLNAQRYNRRSQDHQTSGSLTHSSTPIQAFSYLPPSKARCPLTLLSVSPAAAL